MANESNNKKYGILLNEHNIKLYRNWFKQLCKLIGVMVSYRAPLPDKHWTNYSEIESNYATPVEIGCMFNEFPDQKTLKLLGWVSELNDGESLISVPYDLPNLQVGALFEFPSAMDNTPPRLFRVTKISLMMIYPASVTCALVPEYTNTFAPEQHTFKQSSMNLLNREKDRI